MERGLDSTQYVVGSIVVQLDTARMHFSLLYVPPFSRFQASYQLICSMQMFPVQGRQCEFPTHTHTLGFAQSPWQILRVIMGNSRLIL